MLALINLNAFSVSFVCLHSTFRNNVNKGSAALGILYGLVHLEGDIVVEKSTGSAILVSCYERSLVFALLNSYYFRALTCNDNWVKPLYHNPLDLVDLSPHK